MNLGDRDLFEMWRLLLATICTVYAVVVTGRSLCGWHDRLSGSGRGSSMVRTYALVQLLRLRFRRFAWEFLQIGVLLIILALVLFRHT